MRHKLAPDFSSRRRSLHGRKRVLVKCDHCRIVDLATDKRKKCRFCDGEVHALNDYGE